jgi:hypothetical protein
MMMESLPASNLPDAARSTVAPLVGELPQRLGTSTWLCNSLKDMERKTLRMELLFSAMSCLTDRRRMLLVLRRTLREAKAENEVEKTETSMVFELLSSGPEEDSRTLSLGTPSP